MEMNAINNYRSFSKLNKFLFNCRRLILTLEKFERDGKIQHKECKTITEEVQKLEKKIFTKKILLKKEEQDKNNNNLEQKAERVDKNLEDSEENALKEVMEELRNYFGNHEKEFKELLKYLTEQLSDLQFALDKTKDELQNFTNMVFDIDKRIKNVEKETDEVVALKKTKAEYNEQITKLKNKIEEYDKKIIEAANDSGDMQVFLNPESEQEQPTSINQIAPQPGF